MFFFLVLGVVYFKSKAKVNDGGEFFPITLQCQFSVGKSMVQEQISICLISGGITRETLKVQINWKTIDYTVQKRCFVWLTLILRNGDIFLKWQVRSELSDGPDLISSVSLCVLLLPHVHPGNNSYGRVLELNCIFLECSCQGFFLNYLTFLTYFNGKFFLGKPVSLHNY